MQRGHVRLNPSGRYSCHWRGPDEHGVWGQRSQGGFKTEKAAWRYVTLKIADLERGQVSEPSTMPLGEYLPVWLKGRRGLESSSQRSYANAIKNQIVPHLGTVKLSKLSRNQVSAWVTALDLAGYAPATIELAYTTLRCALDDAALDGMIRVNPLGRRAVELPAARKPPMRILSAAELHALLDAAEGATHAPLLRFLMASQCRIGEALGLNWEDLAVTPGAVRIERQWDEKEKALRALKSDTSTRTVELDAEALEALQAHHDRQRFLQQHLPHARPEIVFPGRDGRLYSTTVRHWLTRLAKRAGLDPEPPITPHTFRHTGATMLLRARVPVHVVAARLGHKDEATTLRHYAHVIPGDDAEAAQTLALLIAREAAG